MTWRGEDQFKVFKAKAKPLPAGHDPSSRAEAMKYTREKDLMSLGVLYEVLNPPSLTDRTEELKKRAKMDKPPTTEEIVRTFLPEL